MSLHSNILIVDDDTDYAETMATQLHEAGHACTVALTAEDAVHLLRTQSFDVLVLDYAIEGGGGRDVMVAARAAKEPPQIIAVTSDSNPMEAVQVMQLGALTYLQKPLVMMELHNVVGRAAERAALEHDRATLLAELECRFEFGNMIGSSPQMQRVFEMIRHIARTDATVLIQGETGTGKELVARTLHYNSSRAGNRFVPLNCAGLAETILESELFGHEKGSFTGATAQRIGMFEYATNGTIFLDEIGDMPLTSQVKLLRVLEHNEITRVGSNQPIKIDVRVVAATNQELARLVEEGEFRRDLYYRLNVVSINLPNLSEREGDIALLTDRFVREFSESHKRPLVGLSPEARRVLYRYTWPGNVRELRNCIEHMIVVTRDPELGMDDLPDYILDSIGMAKRLAPASSVAGLPLDEVEKDHIRRTLEMVEGNREKAAQLLGIGERTLYRKIEKYGLK